MKVLFRIRSDVNQFPGGDYVQLLKTQQALAEFNVRSRIVPGVEEVEERFDVVHLFNTTRIHETAIQLAQAARRGLPVVVSPIWHSLAEMKRCYRRLYRLPYFPVKAYLAAKEAWYARRSGLPLYLPAIFNFAGLQRLVLSSARAILPNSTVEAEMLQRESGAVPAKIFIVPFGFDRPAAHPLPWNQRRDVLCAGRIEPRKNQLSIIAAFKSLPRGEDKLILYGAWNDSHPGYARRVRAELVPGWVEYGGQLPQDQLYAAFAAAKVVVLASFFETFGLVALEGIACGAAVCVSDSGYTRGFFDDYVSYCDPFQVKSIGAAIKAALSQLPPDFSALLARFSWQKAAAKTFEAYQYAIGQA